MRHQLTPSEAALWSQISRNQLGVAFRRQVLIGNRYIVDFLAPSIKHAVEVDGLYHARRGLVGATIRGIPFDVDLRIAEEQAPADYQYQTDYVFVLRVTGQQQGRKKT